MNVELPHDVGEFLRQLVVTGRFESEEDAITAGLRLLRSREELRADVARGFRQLDDGDWVEGKEVFAEAQREIDAVEKDQLES